jgi:putative two-component system response regulator
MIHGIEDYHDVLTEKHECRTGLLMSILGKAYGLDDPMCALLEQLGSIHDIGKIAISAEILEKVEPLTACERKIIEMHPNIGYDFIKEIEHPDAKLGGLIILTHHENHDGTGYPRGLSGDDIPLEGALCMISDVYDALRSRRPYREDLSHEAVLEMMYDTSPAGLYHKFRPELMSAFKEISKEVEVLYQGDHHTF